MSNEMRCCKKLSHGVQRAFFCKQCSKENAILCEDCATFCHPLHELAEINLDKNVPLLCDCGNERDNNRLCLNSTKPTLNTENIYVFTSDVPKFKLQYYDRRCELLAKSGDYYIKRATHLVKKSFFLEAMEDINTAIAWDCKKVIARILSPEAVPFVESVPNVVSSFTESIENMDHTIMPSVELVRFCKRVRSTCGRAKQKTTNSGDVNLILECLDGAEMSILEKFWSRASSLDEIHIFSKVQFEIYENHVALRRKENGNEKAYLHLHFKFFISDNTANFLKVVSSRGFLYESH